MPVATPGRGAPGGRQLALRGRAGDAVAAEALDLLERHDGLAGELAVGAVGLAHPVARGRPAAACSAATASPLSPSSSVPSASGGRRQRRRGLGRERRRRLGRRSSSWAARVVVARALGRRRPLGGGRRARSRLGVVVGPGQGRAHADARGHDHHHDADHDRDTACGAPTRRRTRAPSLGTPGSLARRRSRRAGGSCSSSDTLLLLRQEWGPRRCQARRGPEGRDRLTTVSPFRPSRSGVAIPSTHDRQ